MRRINSYLSVSMLLLLNVSCMRYTVFVNQPIDNTATEGSSFEIDMSNDLSGGWFIVSEDELGKEQGENIWGDVTYDCFRIMQNENAFIGLMTYKATSWRRPDYIKGNIRDGEIHNLSCYDYNNEPNECDGKIRQRGKVITIDHRWGKMVLVRKSHRPSWIPLPPKLLMAQEIKYEVRNNLLRIRNTQIGHGAEHGFYVGNQPSTPVRNRRSNSLGIAWPNDTRFSLLGFKPNTYYVRCSYSLEGGNYPRLDEGITIVANCDLDEDGRLSTWKITDRDLEIMHSGDDY